MFSSAWIRFGPLLIAVGCVAAATTPAIGREPRAHGQRLVAQYQLPPETIARYAAMAAGTALGSTPRENSMFADRSPWVGPEQRAGAGKNPYTLVLTVSGVAKAAGEAYAQWQAGWEIQESPAAHRELLMAVPRNARTAARAGEALTMTASSTRVSFRGERSVAPMLGLVQSRNLDIRAVQMQVWSGEAPQVWPVLPAVPAPLWALGAACLLVGWSVRHWRSVATGSDMRPASRIGLPRTVSALPVDAVYVERAATPNNPLGQHGRSALRAVLAGRALRTQAPRGRPRAGPAPTAPPI